MSNKMGYKDFLVEYYTFLTISTNHDKGKESSDDSQDDDLDDTTKNNVDSGYLSKYHPSRIRQWMELAIAGSS